MTALLVQAREAVLQASLDVLAAERHLADDDESFGRMTEAEHKLDRAAHELADALDTMGRPR